MVLQKLRIEAAARAHAGKRCGQPSDLPHVVRLGDLRSKALPVFDHRYDAEGRLIVREAP